MKFNKNRAIQILSFLAWGGLAGLFFMGSISAVDSQGKREIKEVKYYLEHLSDGNDLITVDEIRDRVFKTYNLDFVGVEIERLDLVGLEEILLKEPFIVDVDAYVDSRDILHLDISQRTPILRVMGLDGSNYYLDANGTKLPLSKHFTARVPVLSGSVSEYQEDFLTTENSLKQAFRIIEASRNDDFVASWLEGLYVNRNHDIWMTGNVGDFKVIFGDDHEIDKKFTKMKKFFKKGLKITGWKNIESIDLKYDR